MPFGQTVSGYKSGNASAVFIGCSTEVSFYLITAGNKYLMRVNAIVVLVILVAASCILSSTSTLYGAEERYDLVYVWDSDLESVLDYTDQLEGIFEKDISSRLKIVERDDEYGVIYDANGSTRSVAQEVARHGEVLRKAGLREAWAIKDEGYHRLYNVSYGLGPNLESLKKTYKKLYTYLGKEAGRNLFIEKTDSNNYTLIYRCREDRVTTMDVASKHAKVLRAKKIRTSITPENSNEVVYGESSLLDDSGNENQASAKEVASISTDIPKERSLDVATKIKDAAPDKIPFIARTESKNVFNASRKGSKKSKSQRKTVDVVDIKSNTVFERNIERFIKDLRRKGAIRSDEKTGWMVYDLQNDRSLVGINANQVFQAASMIKPFVALAFFHEVKRGKLTYGKKSRKMIEAMIQRSSNSATNWVMRQVGGPYKCEQILNKNYKRIFKNTDIREYIPASGRTYKNSALPSDYIRFLRALWKNELPYYKEMRRIMALPGRDRLYHGTRIPQGTLVYNKTGSTAHLIGDMGILVPKTQKGRRHAYAIVGIIERSSRASNYGGWMLARGNVIRQVSTIVYQEMKKKYHLR